MAGETKRVRYECTYCKREIVVSVERGATPKEAIVCPHCNSRCEWRPPRVGVTYNTKMATRGRREAEASGGGVDK